MGGDALTLLMALFISITVFFISAFVAQEKRIKCRDDDSWLPSSGTILKIKSEDPPKMLEAPKHAAPKTPLGLRPAKSPKPEHRGQRPNPVAVRNPTYY